MMIPGPVIELDDANSALSEPPGQETVRTKTPIARLFDAVKIQHFLRFMTEVGELGDAGLHLERHFVLRDAGRDLRVKLLLSERAIQAFDFFDELTLRALANTIGVADVVDGVAARLKRNALKAARQDAARPL